MTMKCPSCNTELSDGALFCPKCGVSVREPEPHHTTDYNDNVRVVYTPEPQQSSSNGALYGIVGFLVAAVIGLGIWMFVRSTGDDQQPPQAQVAQTTQQTATTSSQAQQKTAQPVAAPAPAPQRTYTIQGQHRMRGSISQYPITMEIYVSGTQVSGTYYYHSQGSSNRMTVDGYINGTYMVLEEYAPSGLNTGYFHGDFNGYSYSGQFTNYQKQSNLSFRLTEI